jgi:hypothetical protein
VNVKQKVLSAVLLPVKLVAVPVLSKIGEMYVKRRQKRQLLDFVDNTNVEEIKVEENGSAGELF